MGEAPFHRVLIANRGEIAVRVIRACRDLGIETVAIYSDADEGAAHVRMADRAIRIGPASPAESYLRIEAIVEAARTSGADAIHPGYGFLSERAAFARAVEAAGIVFIGPSPHAIQVLGDKLNARRIARDAGVPCVPGTLEPAAVDRPDAVDGILALAADIGFPLLVKAAAGGGGRGMRRVETAAALPAALAAGSHEALSAFGDGSVYLERELLPARHIEVQLLGDTTGHVIALGERDCSLQRRHQKLVEEAPAPGLTPAQRATLHGMAVRVVTAARLTNAATCEFLRTEDGAFHFLEVNTRLQVEHGVTELVSGVDIVREQLFLAAGRPLSDEAIAAAGTAAEPERHAIEVRISAEDPGHDFAPTPGRISHWQMPAGPGVRVDTAIAVGDRVPPEYDNLIAKVIVVAPDRDQALDRLRRAIDEAEVGGIQTTLPFHRFVARDASFRAGSLSTGWVEEHWLGGPAFERAERLARAGAGLVAISSDARSGNVPTMQRRQPAPPDRAGRSGWAQAAFEAGVDRWPG